MMKFCVRLLTIAFVLSALLAMPNVAAAQIGVRLKTNPSQSTRVGIEHPSGTDVTIQCPDGNFVYQFGSAHILGNNNAGATSWAGFFCLEAHISESGALSTPFVPRGPYFEIPGTPGTSHAGWNYGPFGTSQCTATGVTASLGGRTEMFTGEYHSVYDVTCRTLTIDEATGWVQIGAQIARQNAGDAGTPNKEYPMGCVDSLLQGVTARQVGAPNGTPTGRVLVLGSVTSICGDLIQSRMSARVSTEKYAWALPSLAPLRVSITQFNGATATPMTAEKGQNPTGRQVYLTTTANTPAYQSTHEVYVVPETRYGARLTTSTPLNATGVVGTWVEGGTCLTGVVAVNLQDQSCVIEIIGRPDLAVGLTLPANGVINRFDHPFTAQLRVANRGPGRVESEDNYRVALALPTGFVPANLPSDCTQSGAAGAGIRVSCAVGGLAASASASVDGGVQVWSINFTVPPGTTNAAKSFTASLDKSGVPAGKPADLLTTNDNVTASTTPLFIHHLRLNKSWQGAVANDIATLSAVYNGTLHSFNAIATGETGSQASNVFPLGAGAVNVVTLSEVPMATNAGDYNASAWTCSKGTLNGKILTFAANTEGSVADCTITNTHKTADLSIVKTMATPAAQILPGNNVVWNIVVQNAGPNSADNAVVRDVFGTGYDCTIPPPPTCTATGSAQCPASITAQTLASGVAIPRLPVGGVVTIAVTCQVTATGRNGN